MCTPYGSSQKGRFELPPHQDNRVIPLFRQIFETLRADLSAGRIRVGERLPSENALARQLGVSRITAKKALDELAHAGLVERVQGKGTFALSGDKNPHARRAEDRLISFVLPDFAEAYGLELIHAAERRTEALGAHLLVKRTLGSAERETQAIRALLRLKAQGLIIFPVHGEHYNPELLKLVLNGFPVVLVDRYLRGIPAPSIYTDNRQAAAALTAHVLAEGYGKVAFVSPPPEHTSTIEDRLLGVETALARRGLVLMDTLTLHSSLPGSFTTENIRADEARIHTFVQTHGEVEAFIASEYNLALVLMRTLIAAGKRVPEDVAVACFDAPAPSLNAPLFTHIRQNETEMGTLAVELLERQLTGERLTGAYPLSFELIEGRSTRRTAPYAGVTKREVAELHPALDDALRL
jgi:GntR family transcriptional regulator of arabinose operon